MYKVCAAFTMSISMALALPPTRRSVSQGQPRVDVLLRRIRLPIHQSLDRCITNRSAMLHHRNRRNIQPFFNGGFCCETLNGVPNVRGRATDGPDTGDFTYTYKNDFPWDWAHRYPPNLFGTAPELIPPPVSYRPGCAAQAVTAPGADGKDQTINMIRC